MLSRTKEFPIYPSIFVGWDNTPRRGRNSIVIVKSTSEAFAAGLHEMVQSVTAKPYDDRLIFINAWNEWAGSNPS